MKRYQSTLAAFAIPSNIGVLLALAGVLLPIGGCGPKKGPTISEDSPGETVPAPAMTGEVEVYEEKSGDGTVILREDRIKRADGTYIRHGKVTYFWGNGKKKSEVHYINGVRHGSRIAWYQSGQMWSSGQFVDGREDGDWTAWFPDGRKAQVSTYDHGAWHGAFIEWHLSGNKRTQVEWVRGMKQGTETFWDEDGVVLRETEFVDGVAQP